MKTSLEDVLFLVREIRGTDPQGVGGFCWLGYAFVVLLLSAAHGFFTLCYGSWKLFIPNLVFTSTLLLVGHYVFMTQPTQRRGGGASNTGGAPGATVTNNTIQQDVITRNVALFEEASQGRARGRKRSHGPQQAGSSTAASATNPPPPASPTATPGIAPTQSLLEMQQQQQQQEQANAAAAAAAAAVSGDTSIVTKSDSMGSSELYMQLRYHGLHLVTPRVFAMLHADPCTSACTVVAIQHCKTGMWLSVQTYHPYDKMCMLCLNDIYASELNDDPFQAPPTQFVLHKLAGGMVAFRSIENSRFLGYNVLGNLKVNNTVPSSWDQFEMRWSKSEDGKFALSAKGWWLSEGNSTQPYWFRQGSSSIASEFQLFVRSKSSTSANNATGSTPGNNNPTFASQLSSSLK